jgi:mannose-6-phosphate isomerase-like protein (cupin superfamily)
MVNVLKLPFKFDPQKLKDDLSKISNDKWYAHFNKSDYEGEWEGIALRAPVGAVHPILQLAPHPGIKEFTWTDILDSCSYLKEALNIFKCPLKSVRLLKLKPGSIIKEHSDSFLAFEEGEARMHIPIQTNNEIYFYLQGKRIIMTEGETWYLNFSLKHRIENRSKMDRVHLVIDCDVNEWLTNIFYSVVNV